MDVEQAERFVAAAERDYGRCVADYSELVTAGMGVQEARADVLAAQQVLDLARNELRWQQVCAREREAAQEERARREAEAALRAHDDVIRERRRREREDRAALDRAQQAEDEEQ